MTTQDSSRTTLPVVLKLLSAGCLIFAGASLAEEQAVTAVFKAQEVSFQYRLNRFQACHELETRVSNILRAIGARDDIDVQVRNCDAYVVTDDARMDPFPASRSGSDPFNRDSDPFDRADPFDRSGSSTFGNRANERRPSASIRIRLMMPVELTPAIMKELEKDKSRRELVSRVTRNPAAAFNEPIVFEARRQEVTLSARTVRLEREDCDLLEQMSTQLFRKLNVKVTRRGASCGRDQSQIPPQMTVEALVPTGALRPMPDPEKKSGESPAGDPADKPAEPGVAPATPAPLPQP